MKTMEHEEPRRSRKKPRCSLTPADGVEKDEGGVKNKPDGTTAAPHDAFIPPPDMFAPGKASFDLPKERIFRKAAYQIKISAEITMMCNTRSISAKKYAALGRRTQKMVLFMRRLTGVLDTTVKFHKKIDECAKEILMFYKEMHTYTGFKEEYTLSERSNILYAILKLEDMAQQFKRLVCRFEKKIARYVDMENWLRCKMSAFYASVEKCESTSRYPLFLVVDGFEASLCPYPQLVLNLRQLLNSDRKELRDISKMIKQYYKFYDSLF